MPLTPPDFLAKLPETLVVSEVNLTSGEDTVFVYQFDKRLVSFDSSVDTKDINVTIEGLASWVTFDWDLG